MIQTLLISESLWILGDKLTFVLLPSDPHYTLRWISSKAKAAIHLEGESAVMWTSHPPVIVVGLF